MQRSNWRPLLYALVFGSLVGAGLAFFWQGQQEDDAATGVMEPLLPGPSLPRASGAENQADISRTRTNAITRAAAAVGPAVVAIAAIQTRVVRTQAAFDDFWSRFFVPRVYRQQVQSVGTGVIVTPDGYVLTNEHVTEGAEAIQVTLGDGRTFAASLIGSDRESDLAVLRIDGEDLPAARLGDSDSLLIGEWAIALGNPFGFLLADAKPTVTVGVISALDRDVKRSPDDDRVYRKLIQTDAAINPGNSGGPLVNADGEVVGINSFIFSSSRGSEGIGFAIPVNQARVIFADLVRYGETRPAWVGVGIQPVPVGMGEAGSGARRRGVIISSVQPESPASRAGLRPEDIVRRIGTHPVANVADWDGIAAFWRPGEEVTLGYLRGDREQSLTLELVARPLDVAPSEEVNPGFWVADVSLEIASQLGLQNQGGVVVTRVGPKSPAAAAGFERGDIIRQVNNRTVADTDDLRRRLATGANQRRTLIGLERDGQRYLAAYDR